MNENLSRELVNAFLLENPMFVPVDGLVNENALFQIANYLSELAGGISPPPPPPTLDPKNPQQNT